jgi:prophage antirepressor-like protein
MEKMSDDIVKVFDSEKGPFTAIMYKGRPAVIAKEFGARLGYSAGGSKLVKMITGEWEEFFEGGKHYVVLRGRELADFKELIKAGPSRGLARASHIMLLFKPGMYKVAFKSGKPEAEPLIDFIVDRVFPQLEADGRFDPARTVDENGQLVGAGAGGAIIKPTMAERKMALAEIKAENDRNRIALDLEKLVLANKKEVRLDEMRRAAGVRKAAKIRFEMGRIDADGLKAEKLKSYELEAGGRVGTFDSDGTLDGAGRLYSPEEVGQRCGVDKILVGRIVSQIGEEVNSPNIRRDIRYTSPRKHDVEFMRKNPKNGGKKNGRIYPDGYLMRENLMRMVVEKIDAIQASQSRQGNLPFE